jgi:glutamate carboxypeptidase
MSEAVRAHLSARLGDYLAALRNGVAVNSFTENPAGVARLANWTAALFAPLGFAAERVASAGGRFGPHLFLHRPGRSGRHVALVSHLDTVYPPEEELAQGFVWREEGDRLYGPGVADIKGGTVVAFMALDALRAVHPEMFAQASWLVALDAAEEQMQPDFPALCRERLPAGRTLACLVFECGVDTEPGRCPLVVTRKGMANFRVEVEGRAAHAGTGYWRGRNAILDAARLALDLAEVSERERELTVNVGVIAGGTVTNRVPHRCVLQGEVRAFDPVVLHEGMARIGERVAGAPAVLMFADELSPWPANAGSEGLLALWRAVGERLGLRIEPERRAGLSAGNLLWDLAPTLDGLGPVGGNCHCSQPGADGRGQEYALRSSFVSKAALTAEGLRELIVSAGGGS